MIPFRQQNFSGGENLRIYPTFMLENQVIRAKNCNITDGGFLETRFGKVKINTTSFGASPVLGVWRYVKEDASKYLVVQHNTSLWAASWDGSSTIATFTEVKTGLSAVKLSGLVWKDQLILGNGTNNLFRFNGVSCADLGGTPPKMKVFTVYAGRIFGVDADNPSNLRYCDLEDYDTWNALNIIKVRDQDGDAIKGLQPREGGLVILKDTSIWPLYGSSRDDIRLGLTPLDDTVGCVSNEGSLPQGVCFSGDNIQYFGVSSVMAIADSHTPIFNSLTDAEKRAVIVGVQPNIKRGIFYIPGKDTAVVVHGRHAYTDQGGTVRFPLTTWEGLNANCFAVADGVGDDNRLILGDATAGNVYMLTGATDEGTDIETKIKTAYYDYGAIVRKEWRKFDVEIAMREESGEVMDGYGDTIGDGYGSTISGATTSMYDITTTIDVDYKDTTASENFTGTVSNKRGWDDSTWETAFWGYQADVDIEHWIHDAIGDRASLEITCAGRCLLRGYKALYNTMKDEAQ